MNYNNFDQYIKNQQIYSNELHIILSKTPPRLFRMILGAIALAAIILVSFAFVVKYEDFSEARYVLKVQPDQSVHISALAHEQNIHKIAKAGRAIISVNAPGTAYGRQEVNIPLDSLTIAPVYEVNGKLYDNLSAMGDMALTNPGVIKKYRLSLSMNKTTAAKYFEEGLQPQTGSVKFISGRKRLINKFINLP